jgi:hypothetical protein
MNPITNTQTDPPKVVPVLSQSPWNMFQRWFASAVQAVGMFIFALQAAQPDIVTLLPHKPWVGPTITATATMWLAMQRFNDKSKQQLVKTHTE